MISGRGPTGAAAAGSKSPSETGEIPLFVREGSLVPMLKEPVMNSERAYGRTLEVRFYGRTGGTFDLYEDDGKTFDYDKGKYRDPAADGATRTQTAPSG